MLARSHNIIIIINIVVVTTQHTHKLLKTKDIFFVLCFFNYLVIFKGFFVRINYAQLFATKWFCQFFNDILSCVNTQMRNKK